MYTEYASLVKKKIILPNYNIHQCEYNYVQIKINSCPILRLRLGEAVMNT